MMGTSCFQSMNLIDFLSSKTLYLVQWPPIPHWLKHLQVVFNNRSSLAISLLILLKSLAQILHPQQTTTQLMASPAFWCKHWKTWASSENRVCSFLSCIQHECWSFSPVCSLSLHLNTYQQFQPSHPWWPPKVHYHPLALHLIYGPVVPGAPVHKVTQESTVLWVLSTPNSTTELSENIYRWHD